MISQKNLKITSFCIKIIKNKIEVSEVNFVWWYRQIGYSKELY